MPIKGQRGAACAGGFHMWKPLSELSRHCQVCGRMEILEPLSVDGVPFMVQHVAYRNHNGEIYVSEPANQNI